MSNYAAPHQIADAIESLEWKGCSIGHKVILANAVAALRATQPAGGEPVAWMYDTPNNGRQYSGKRLDHYWWDALKDSYVKGVPLYATQPAVQLWAVHAQGPDDLYAAFSREDADAHAEALNALPCPPGISVSAVVIESPWSAAEHWKYLVEQEREHNNAAPPAAAPAVAGAPVAWRYVEITSEGYPYAPQFSAKRWQVTPEEYSEEPLYLAQPAAAHGDSLSFGTVEELAEAIRQVAAYEELGPELIAEEMFKQAGAVETAHGDDAVAFANELISGALEGGDFCGADIQELALKHGLLREERREEPCREEGCACAEYGFPTECYRKTTALAAMRAQGDGEVQ